MVPCNSHSVSPIVIRVLISFLCLSPVLPGLAQSSRKLKERRESLLREIALTDQALERTRNQEKQALESLLLLDQQLLLRQEAVEQVRREADTLRAAIVRLEGEAGRAAQARQEALSTYRRLARYRLYARLQGGSPLLHFLAAPRLSESFQRAFLFDRLALRSSESARHFRRQQTEWESLRSQKEEARKEVERVLGIEEKQRSRLEIERTERGNLVRQLRRNASSLQADLSSRQSERQKLEEAIASAIRKEIEAEEEKARKAATAAKTTGKTAPKAGGKASAALPAAPSATTSGGDFARNKGRLPWPVEHAAIARPFGEQRHPDLPQVRIKNTGLDLRTHPAAPVKAVFEGNVTGVQWVPGYAYTVILRHGNHYTVYSNLDQIAVKKGDAVKAGTVVGQASKDPVQGTGALHFEVWSGKNRQDPALWLTPKR